MVTKIKKGAAGASSTNSTGAGKGAAGVNIPLQGLVKESAQQIWLAGLGAFSKAQAEGGKVFEALVREGVNLQRKTQTVAEEKLGEATSRMAGMATDISSKASGQWDKLEGIFEERVNRALNKLGVPSAKDVELLVQRIDALQRSVDRLSGHTNPAKTGAKAAARAPAKKAVPRRAPAKAARTVKAAKATKAG